MSDVRLIDGNELLKHAFPIYGLSDCSVEIHVVPITRIKEAPTIEPPVVRGRWMGWGKGGMQTYQNYGTCSECNEDVEIATEHRNFCPNCGAKMEVTK